MADVNLTIRAQVGDLKKELDLVRAKLQQLEASGKNVGANIGAAGAKATAGLNTANKAASSGIGLYQKLGAQIAATFAVGAVTTFASTSLRAFAEAEEGVKLLTLALEGQDDVTARLIDRAKSIKAVSVFDDDDIIRQQAFLAQQGLLEAQINKVIDAAIALSSVTGGELSESVRKLQGTLIGELPKGLDKLVDGIDDLTEAELRNGAALDLVTEKYGKFVSDALETTSGKLKVLARDWEDFKETVGAFVAGTGIVPFLSDIVQGLQDIPENTSLIIAEFEKLLRLDFSGGFKSAEAIREDKLQALNEIKEFADGLKQFTDKDLAAYVRDTAAAYRTETKEENRRLLAKRLIAAAQIKAERAISDSVVNSVNEQGTALEQLGKQLQAAKDKLKEYNDAGDTKAVTSQTVTVQKLQSEYDNLSKSLGLATSEQSKQLTTTEALKKELDGLTATLERQIAANDENAASTAELIAIRQARIDQIDEERDRLIKAANIGLGLDEDTNDFIAEWTKAMRDSEGVVTKGGLQIKSAFERALFGITFGLDFSDQFKEFNKDVQSGGITSLSDLEAQIDLATDALNRYVAADDTDKILEQQEVVDGLTAKYIRLTTIIKGLADATEKAVEADFEARFDPTLLLPKPKAKTVGNAFLESLGIDKDSISEAEQILNQSIGTITDSIQTAIDAWVTAKQEQVDFFDNRLSQQQQAVELELQLSEAGYANNLDIERRKLADLQAERDKAHAEAVKAQKQQLAIESTIQAAQTVTTAINLIKGAVAINPILGLIAGAAATASLFALIASIKARSQTLSKMRKGGEIRGASHEQGGVKVPEMGIELEGGEFVVNRKATSKHRELLTAINEDDENFTQKILQKRFEKYLKNSSKSEHSQSVDSVGVQKFLDPPYTPPLHPPLQAPPSTEKEKEKSKIREREEKSFSHDFLKILNTSSASSVTKSIASEVISTLETYVKNYESLEYNTENVKTRDLTHFTPLVMGKYQSGGERAKYGTIQPQKRQISEVGISGTKTDSQIAPNTDTYKNIYESLREIYKTGEVVTDKLKLQNEKFTNKETLQKLSDSTTAKQLDTFNSITSLEKTASDLVTFEKLSNNETLKVNNVDQTINSEIDRRQERIERIERQKTKDIDESRLLKAVLMQLKDMNNSDSETMQGKVKVVRKGNTIRKIRNA